MINNAMWRLIQHSLSRRYRILMAEADRKRDAGHPLQAALVYERAAERFPSDAGLLVLQGNMLKDGGRYAEARSVYENALVRRPSDADLHVQLGHLSKLEGKRNEAAKWFERAVKLDPNRQDATEELARVSAHLPSIDPDLDVSATVLTSADRQDLVLQRLQIAFARRPA